MGICGHQGNLESLQSTPCASKRFGAILLGHKWASVTALGLWSTPMRSPKALCSVPFNKVVVLIPDASVLRSV
jgi:hypothetical protein